MFKILFKTKEKIRQELIYAFRWKIPDKLNVTIKPSKDGGFIGEVNNLPGCITQGENGQEIFEMVNDAVYSYFEIPEEYKIYMPSFFPSEKIRRELNIKLPSSSKELIFVKS